MVRVARFGWLDAGPLRCEQDQPGWLSDDDEPELEPRRTRRRSRLRRTSPVDRSTPANERSSERQDAA